MANFVSLLAQPDDRQKTTSEILDRDGYETNEISYYTDWKITGAHFQGETTGNDTEFTQCILDHCDFTNDQTSYHSFHSTTILNTSFKNTRLRKSTFIDCTLNKVSFDQAKLPKVLFLRGTFRNVSFVKADLASTHFIDCNLNEANFDDALLSGVAFTNCILSEELKKQPNASWKETEYGRSLIF